MLNKKSIELVPKVDGLEDLERLADDLKEHLEAARKAIDKMSEVELKVDLYRKEATDDIQSRNKDKDQG